MLSDHYTNFTQGAILMNKNQNRKLYRKPRLEVLGDLRTLTLGGSPGLNDSGSEFTRKPPPIPPTPGFPLPLPEGVPTPGEQPPLW
jgi:hypothetical protein